MQPSLFPNRKLSENWIQLLQRIHKGWRSAIGQSGKVDAVGSWHVDRVMARQGIGHVFYNVQQGEEAFERPVNEWQAECSG